MASLFIGHAAQKSKLHNLQYDEGGNHMAETETESCLNEQSSEKATFKELHLNC